MVTLLASGERIFTSRLVPVQRARVKAGSAEQVSEFERRTGPKARSAGGVSVQELTPRRFGSSRGPEELTRTERRLALDVRVTCVGETRGAEGLDRSAPHGRSLERTQAP